MQTVLHLNSNYRNIPSDYQQVAYHSSLKYATCNTGYIMKQNSVIEIKFRSSESTSLTSYIGVGETSSTYPLRIYTNGSQLYMYRMGVVKVINGIEPDKEYIINLRDTKYAVNGNVYTVSACTNAEYTKPVGISGYMESSYDVATGQKLSNGNPTALNAGSDGKIYYVRIWETDSNNTDVLVHDYVPCYRRSDLREGWYDMVTGEFLYPQNTIWAEQGLFTNQIYYRLFPGPHVYEIPEEYKQIEGITISKGTAISLFTVDTAAITRVLIGVRYQTFENGAIDKMGCSNFNIKATKNTSNANIIFGNTGGNSNETITGDVRSKSTTIGGSAYGYMHQIYQLVKSASTNPGNNGVFSIGGVTNDVASTSLTDKYISFVEHYGVSNGQLRLKEAYVACQRIGDKKIGFYNILTGNFTVIDNAVASDQGYEISTIVNSYNYLNETNLINNNTQLEVSSSNGNIQKISKDTYIINTISPTGKLYRIKKLGMNDNKGPWVVSFSIYKDIANQNDDIGLSCDICDTNVTLDKSYSDISGTYISCKPQRKVLHATVANYYQTNQHNGFLDLNFTSTANVRLYLTNLKLTRMQADSFNSFRNLTKLPTTVLSNQGTLTYDSTENGYYITNADSYVKTTFNTISGHKYYIQFDHKWNIDSTNTIYIYQGSIGTAQLFTVNTTNTTQGWETIKGIFTATDNSIIYIGKKGLASTTKTYYRNMFMIDITDMNDISSSITADQLSNLLPLNIQDSGFLRSSIAPNNNVLVKSYEIGGYSPKSLYDNNIYREPDGSLWIRIAHQEQVTGTTNLFNSSVDARTADDRVSDLVWLNSMVLYDFIGRWELLVVKKITSETQNPTKYRWVQYKNPLLSTYNDIHGNITRNTSSGYNTSNYGGLFWKQNGQHLICDNNTNGSNWYGICGYNSYTSGGVTGTPAFMGDILTTGYQNLYIRIDKAIQPSYDFNGKSSVMILDEPLRQGVSDSTNSAVSFWMKLNDVTNDQVVYFDNKFGSSSMLKIKVSGSTYLFQIASNRTYTVSGLTQYILRGYNHILVSTQSGTQKLYFNGALATLNSTSNTGVVGQSNALYIGNANDGYSAASQPYFNGRILDFKLVTGINNDSDALKFYNKELNKYK